jgi:hypothetical protein
MITFLIKSTVCLVVLYVFFHFFLRSHKILLFNRFYLILSLVFSLIIPLIIIPIKSNIPLIYNFVRFTFTPEQINQQESIIGNSNSFFNFQHFLITIVAIISSILLIRFVFNILGLIRKTIKCKRIDNLRTSIVLIEEKTLPYSFFRYIFVNKSDFENGKIEKELLIHEEAHCLQYHSIDVIILEIINIFLWFNPAIWLFRKAIYLNHEYYADNKVISNSESFDYHQLLVNLVIQNNTKYLVSNFKYSLIKNRITMMTKSNPSHNSILRKIVAVSLFLFLGIVFTFSQGGKMNSESSNLTSISLSQQDGASNGWWKPIVKKHGITYDSYTIHGSFLILGKKTINNEIESFRDVTAIQNQANNYWIYKSKSASYDSKIKRLKIFDCTMEKFEKDSEKTEPLSSYKHISYSINFDTQISTMADTITY